MNKKIKETLKNMLNKERFYISLFLCICIIIAAGAISYKIISSNQGTKVEEETQNLTWNDNDEKAVSEMQNAERVEKTQDTNKNISNKTNDQSTTVVATKNNVKFVTPIDGVESRNYTYPTPVKVDDDTFRTIKGINIKAPIGTEVKAAADGVVEVLENSGVEEGFVIQIKHSNGLKTRYGNLDENISVSKGDKITANQVIAKVGNTAKVFNNEEFGEFLNLQVIDANGEQVNPEKYFQLKTKQ